MRFIIYTIIVLFLVGCGNSDTEKQTTKKTEIKITESVVSTHPNGNPKDVTFLKEGSEEYCKILTYYENGVLKNETINEDIKSETRWSEDGIIKRKVVIENNMNIEYDYYDNGNIKREDYYDMNQLNKYNAPKLINTIKYTKSGKIK
jgi:hypothetical protein